MVEKKYIQKVVRQLDRYYIKKSNSTLDGSSYAFMLFIPTNLHQIDRNIKYDLILCAKKFDKYPTKELINEIISWLDGNLEKNESIKISSVIIANSNSPFARNVDFVMPIKEDIKILENIYVGNVTINYGILVNPREIKHIM